MPAVINATTVMGHLLSLSERERQNIVSDLLMMGGSDLGDGCTPQINAIGLDFAPAFIDPTPTPSPSHPTLASLPPVDKPPPRPPRSPRRPHSPKIASAPLPVVEDDNTLTGGVKTSSSASVLTFPAPTDELPHQTPPATPRKPVLPAPAHDESPSQAPGLKLPTPTENESPPPRPPRNLRRVYGPLLLTNAFERPRDPDEITPQTPRVPATPQTTSRHRRANAADTTSPAQPTNPVTTRTRDRHTQSTRHARKERHTANIAHANDRIRGWLTRVIYEPPPRNDTRPARTRPPLDPIAEERADHALREYGYDYEDARREG
ncbi:hypothetical protein EDB83DRAFT_2317998 [Lactarius deliciosus]|nr:hypothetical protein EDB83DRAFT_2317998 [Lactarius deliciosus]